ncbi:uncharacterized protein LOC143300973 isoform X2 [Babylonia areolata]|uniref:uncharacterized protein LOC143300973 isoform X2 n=1 Tax=Babylonia areolata TaxID=304850 RepID=UPI003FD441FF
MPPPDRWEDYQALGSLIPETKFIAFKVPLKQEICRNLPENESFSPEQLIKKIEESGKRLGLLIDLTFTRKYYNGQYFVKRDIQYEKIFTKGHEVPSDDVVQRFYEAVDDFYIKNTDEDVVIGVHCTHGVNRTGYMVCRYMIERLKMDPERAITLFGEARGHPIERENYLKDLKMRPLSSSTSPSQTSEIQGNQSSNSAQHANWRQQPHKRDVSSLNRFQTWQGHCSNRRSGGRDHPYNKHSSQMGRHEGAPAKHWSGRAPRSGHHRDAYSSPLEQFDDPRQNRWANAARSGWGSSQGGGYVGAQGYPRGGGRQDGKSQYFHNHQKYSWRRSDDPQSSAGSAGNQGYRDRRQDFQERSHQNEFWGSSRADQDLNWRQRRMEERNPGRGGSFSGHHWHSGNVPQDWHSGDGGWPAGGQNGGGGWGSGNHGGPVHWNNWNS